MKQTIEVLNKMLSDGIIKNYAVGGAVAAIFYIEPMLTYDLDIFFSPANGDSGLLPLASVYDYLKKKGYTSEKEHVLIEGIPVQFLPIYNQLIKDAVDNAAQLNFKETPVNVIRQEYLIAIMVQTFRAKDKERILKFINEGNFNEIQLEKILDKYNLKTSFNSLRKL